MAWGKECETEQPECPSSRLRSALSDFEFLIYLLIYKFLVKNSSFDSTKEKNNFSSYPF